MVKVAKNGGLIIEISGDLEKLRSELKKAEAIAKGAGGEIAAALNGAIDQRAAAREMLSLTKKIDMANRAGDAMRENFENVSEAFRKAGEAINLSGKRLDAFSHLQEKMYKNQTQKAFKNNLEGIQRLTGSTNEQMNQLARTMGGVGDEFSKVSENSQLLQDSLTAMAQKFAGVATAYASLNGVKKFAEMGIASNASLQDATIGLAATLASTHNIIDAQGKMLEGREKFNAAMHITEDLAKLIDAATKSSTASEIQLNQAVQATMGASASLGVSEKDNVKFLAQLANTMSVLQLDLNNLSKEAFSLMTGKGLGNSRLFQQLKTMGISDTDIRSWVKAGTVIENVSKNLESFAFAGEEMARTYKGANRDLESSITGIAELVTKDLTNSLAKASSTLSSTFYTFGENGYALKKEIEPLVDIGKDLADYFGDRMVGSARVFSSSLESVSSIVEHHKETIEGASVALKNLAIGYGAISLAKTTAPLWKELNYERQFFSLASQEVSNYRASLLSLQSVGSRLFKVMGGWTTVLSAVAGGVAYLMFQDSEAEAIAKRYGTTLEELKQRYKGLGESANLTTEAVSNLSQAHKDAIIKNLDTQISQATKDLNSAQEALQKAAKESSHNIEESRRNINAMNQYTDMAPFFVDKKLQSDLNDILQILGKVNVSAEDIAIVEEKIIALNTQLTAQMKETDNGFILNFFNPVYQGLKKLSDTADTTLSRFNELKQLTAAQKKAEEGLATVSGKKVDNGEALKLIAEYHKNSTGYAISKLQEEKKIIQDEMAKGLLSKEQVNEANQAINDIERKIKNFSKSSTSSSSSSSLTGSLESEIKRLQEASLSPLERVEADVQRYLAQGYPQQMVDQWKKLEIKAIDTTKFTEASRALQDFEKEYQNSFKNASDLSASITSQMDKYRDAVKELENQGKLATEEIERLLARIDELQAKNILEQSKDAVDGAKVALQNYAEEATNAAKNVGNAVTNTLNGLEDALTNFVTTGKLQFSDLVNSIIADLARIAVRQSITGPLASAFNSLLGGGNAVPGTDSWGVNNNWDSYLPSPLSTQALGDVFSSTALGSYSDSVVAAPTVFPFAKGMGLMGEAGAEAIMPLTRTSGGHLGVRAVGNDDTSSSPVVNLNVVVNNNSSSEVTTHQRQDSQGNMTLEVIVKEVDRMLSNNIMQGTSKIGSAIDKTRGTNSARTLYNR